MLDIFQFINPLQMQSLQAEKSLLAKTAALDTKVNYKFVPLSNLQIINEYFAMNHQKPTLAERNQLSQVLYQVSSDYEAMAFQGQAKARKFLLALQAALLVENQVYSTALTTTVAKSLDVDLAMFLEDRLAPATAHLVRANQQLAVEMEVTVTPSAMLFDYDRFDYGLLVEDFTPARLDEFFTTHALQPSEKIARPATLHIIGK